MKIHLILAYISGLIAASCFGVQSQDAKPAQQTPFNIEKGINISAWLSQTKVKSGPEREHYFTKADFQQLKALGFDHLRLPVAEDQLYLASGEKDSAAFRLIHQVTGWCQEAGMRLILDLHDLKVSRELKPKPGQVSLWENVAAQDHFIELWTKLSAEFKHHPNNLLAYEPP